MYHSLIAYWPVSLQDMAAIGKRRRLVKRNSVLSESVYNGMNSVLRSAKSKPRTAQIRAEVGPAVAAFPRVRSIRTIRGGFFTLLNPSRASSHPGAPG